MTKEEESLPFGRPAGMAGAAVAICAWVHQVSGKKGKFPAASSWASEKAMIEDLKRRLATVKRKPKPIVLGALGRSGRGAVDVLKAAGLEPTQWDLAETKPGGPFKEILEHDILINCIFLSGKTPPFTTLEELKKPGRKLSVVADVSCDYTSPYNPLPFYSEGTTLSDPTIRVLEKPQVLDVISIDHLPTLLPKESSEFYCKDLFPHLLDLDRGSAVWRRAKKVFEEKSRLATQPKAKY